jgi:Family of unknown function (DUF6527)
MSIKGRLWPVGVSFLPVINDAKTGQHYIHDGFECEVKAGDFIFRDEDDKPTLDPHQADTMEFACPRSGKICGNILVGYPEKPSYGPSWKFDGNFQEPTLLPSINCTGCCGWHGWLQQGQWNEC